MIVIGGGATGAGIAVDAASRGYKLLLLEQSDFGKGTSSRSTKLVHGGVRYLEQGNLSLVMEALKERGLLLQNAPHLVRNLAFVVPAYDWWESPFYGVGLKLYNLLAGKYGFGDSRILSREETLEKLPTINPEGLRGGVVYYDGQFDDARLLIDLLQTAAGLGATVLNYAQVTALDGHTVRVRDHVAGGEFEATGKVLINATGAFTDVVRRMAEPHAEPIIAPSQGVHLVFDRSFLAGDHAIMVPHTSDGRVMFAIPWHDHTVVGTTDTPVTAAELEPVAMEQEVEFILQTASLYLARKPERSDVLSVFAGIRPLVREGGAGNTAALSRGHTIRLENGGMLTICGGKWTTYRRMAEDCVNQAATLAGLPAAPCVTASLRIPPPEPGDAWLRAVRERDGRKRGRRSGAAHAHAVSECPRGDRAGARCGKPYGAGVEPGHGVASAAGCGVPESRRRLPADSVNGGPGVVVAPVEPVVLQHGNRLQALPLRLARSGAALEVPFTAGGFVHQEHTRFLPADAVKVRGAVHSPNAVAECADRLIVRPYHQQDRLGSHAILHQLFFDYAVVRERPAGAAGLNAQHHVAAGQAVLRKSDHRGHALHANVPIAFGIAEDVLRDIVENGPLRLLGFPGCQRQLIGINQSQPAALERPGNRSAADLLPVGAGFLVAHQEVLVVDAGQMKRQPQPCNISRPHQTGVTERSIGGDDGLTVNYVVDHVMVGNAANGIGPSLAADAHGDHLLRRIQLDVARGGECGMTVRVKHLFVDVDPGQAGQHDDEDCAGRRQDTAPLPRLHPPIGGQRQYCRECGDRREEGTEPRNNQCGRQFLRALMAEGLNHIDGIHDAEERNRKTKKQNPGIDPAMGDI